MRTVLLIIAPTVSDVKTKDARLWLTLSDDVHAPDNETMR
jgi:hypothetical protein